MQCSEIEESRKTQSFCLLFLYGGLLGREPRLPVEKESVCLCVCVCVKAMDEDGGEKLRPC